MTAELTIREAPATEAEFQKLLKTCKPEYIRVGRSLYDEVFDKYANTMIRVSGSRYDLVYVNGSNRIKFNIFED